MNVEHTMKGMSIAMEAKTQEKATQASRRLAYGIALARIAWVTIAAFTTYLFILSLPARWNQLSGPYPVVRASLADLGLSINFYAVFTISVEVLVALVFGTVEMILYLHKGRECIAPITGTPGPLIVSTILPAGTSRKRTKKLWL